MKKPILREALDRIQDIIASETGASLKGDAEKRLESVLRDATAHEGTPSGEKFLTRQVTILLADLRGFTSVSENYPVNIVLDLLNS